MTPSDHVEASDPSSCASSILVAREDVGLRLDVWLEQHLPGLSRSRVQWLIASGHVLVNGRRVSQHRKVAEGMGVTVTIPPPVVTGLVAEDIPLDVLYEDPHIIVVNKPSGLVVHPTFGHATGTLVNALLHHCGDLRGIGGEMRPGIVHRLDKDTSGAMVAAKSEQAMAGLAAQFKQGEVFKQYAAIVHGTPGLTVGRIETLIGRSTHDRKKMSATPGRGRRAVTCYEVCETFRAASLLRVRIETGRTHQIRVHMTHMGHPVVGDKQYRRRKVEPVLQGDGPPVNRQMLHAEILELSHPHLGEKMRFEAPLPADMTDLLARLRADREA